MTPRNLALSVLPLLLLHTGEAAAADSKAGQALYAQCAACHGASGLGTPLGPGLRGIIGQPAAREDGFAYSTALKRSKLSWDEATLRAFLIKPSAVVPSTRMIYPGVGAPQKADDLIAYMKTWR